MAEIVPFRPEHLDEVLGLCAAEGWRSLPDDPARALRLLTAPGVTTLVAVAPDGVIGFAQVLSDGELRSYLALLLVRQSRRGEGHGAALVKAVLEADTGGRLDLLSEAGSTSFYERFAHRRLPGYRLYRT